MLANMGDYNSVGGILRDLTDLDSLHELIRARHEAGYQRKEHLDEFLIMGKWFTDSCGNFGRMTIEHRYKEVPWAKDLKPVVSTPSFWEPFRENISITTSLNNKIPRSHDRCPVCLKGWTLENADDAHPWLDVETPHLLHRNCIVLKRAVEGRSYYTDLFTKAGFHWFVLDEIQNEYWVSSLLEPWYLCRTLAGTINIGWRKRVMSIDWSDTRLDLSDLFKSEDVTKGPHMIHAWGHDKAINYLTKVREALGL